MPGCLPHNGRNTAPPAHRPTQEASRTRCNLDGPPPPVRNTRACSVCPTHRTSPRNAPPPRTTLLPAPRAEHRRTSKRAARKPKCPLHSRHSHFPRSRRYPPSPLRAATHPHRPSTPRANGSTSSPKALKPLTAPPQLSAIRPPTPLFRQSVRAWLGTGPPSRSRSGSARKPSRSSLAGRGASPPRRGAVRPRKRGASRSKHR
jgi:hypothetical protein